ncbi:hypothetical protein JKP88DRAFT_237417 [Tribonema minus]|uniref:Uncharacterized protein n=1 Tax=Tribonema minus TaxID=303371 RepID=A0A835YZK3_9STRA|nr:hypothetical protein JKP88DRAFT_237417 [Tribonema minus]
MTVSKFETMQKKRVTVTIQYAGFAGYKLYCDATERLIKEHFPDVIINRVVLPVVGPRSEGTFDILVDDLPVYSKRRDRSSVYLQLEVLRDAVRKKRKERRQGKGVYGDVSTYETVTPDHHQHIRTSAGARAAGGV